MAVRPVRIYGDPVLRQRTREVTTFDESLRQLIADMFDTMQVYNGVGLAANQIGVGQRVLVVDVPIDDEQRERFALVNPVLSHPAGGETGLRLYDGVRQRGRGGFARRRAKISRRAAARRVMRNPARCRQIVLTHG